MDPRIRIRIHPKMSWIRNTDKQENVDQVQADNVTKMSGGRNNRNKYKKNIFFQSGAASEKLLSCRQLNSCTSRDPSL